ncbi:YcxB family protein [Bacillus sp. JJ1562]|uniref:YcxB family protein n=1 Tax=Bacillus sp. JJ1562 TaxID=3122960 RepID=UPI0030029A7A
MAAKNNDKISVSGTLTYADFKKHNSYHRRKNVIGYFIIVFLCSFYVLSDIITGSSILVTIFSLIISSVIILLPVILMNRNLSKVYKNEQLFKDEITYEINDNGICQKTGRSNANIEWSNIFLAIEEKDMFRLYVSKNKAIVLPISFFNSKEEINILKSLIKRNMKSRKVKLRF